MRAEIETRARRVGPNESCLRKRAKRGVLAALPGVAFAADEPEDHRDRRIECRSGALEIPLRRSERRSNAEEQELAGVAPGRDDANERWRHVVRVRALRLDRFASSRFRVRA
jgi:hypothetical protein